VKYHLFKPLSRKLIVKRNMVGLLTYFLNLTPSRQSRMTNSGIYQAYTKLTAAGTVQDLHLIPF